MLGSRAIWLHNCQPFLVPLCDEWSMISQAGSQLPLHQPGCSECPRDAWGKCPASTAAGCQSTTLLPEGPVPATTDWTLRAGLFAITTLSEPQMILQPLSPRPEGSISPRGPAGSLWLVQRTVIHVKNWAMTGANTFLHLHEGLPWLVKHPCYTTFLAT
jgi:hypothetical protein